MADGDDAAYDPMKDPERRPRRSTDLGWNYGYMVTPGNNNIVKCNLCGKVTQGGIKRHKEHLAGTGGDAAGCPRASTKLRREMYEYLEKNRRNQPLPNDDDGVVEVDAAGTTTIQGSTTRPSSGTAAKKNKRAFAVRVSGKKVQSVAAKSVDSMLRRKPEDIVDERCSGCSQSSMESSTKTEEELHYIHTKKRNRLQHRILNDNVFVSYNRKNMDRFQKRREKIGDKSYDPLIIDDFDWGNEWVDPTMPPPQGARGCPDDIPWELVDEAVGASSSLQGRNLPRGTTMGRGPSNVNVQYERQRKRPAPTPSYVQGLDESDDQEDDQEQCLSIPNGEDDASDYVEDDVDVTDDDEDPTSADQDYENTNATMDELDDHF
ncbi:hypothetical protein ACQ4PT_048630 [Festuca glaucescens]